MTAIAAHWPSISKSRHRVRHANAHFRWKRSRAWIPMAAGVAFIIVILTVFLGLGLWYVPEV